MANIIRRNGGNVPAPTQGSVDPFSMMRELLNWDPFREIMPRMPLVGGEQMAFVPQFDIKETKDAYLFTADLPGVNENDVNIELTGNRLTISGKREAEERKENERWFAYERSFGSFTRSFTLPEGVDTDHVDADMKNGVLTVRIGKRPEHQPKKIQLKGGGKSVKA